MSASAIWPFRISFPLSGEWDKFYFPHQTNGALQVLYYANVGSSRAQHVLEWSTNLIDWQDSTAFASTNFSILELVLTNDLLQSSTECGDFANEPAEIPH